MQTFVPYSSLMMNARVLDRQRLGKQRVETLQLLKALSGAQRGWANHPAAKMWRGHENALVTYGISICQEWIQRDYKDTCLPQIQEFYNEDKPLELPSWWGREDVHLSHQSNLVRKLPEHYRRYFPDVPDNLDYVWPEP